MICEDINRVGRDMLDSLRLEKELRTAGVLVFATSEPIDAQAPQASTMLVRRMHMAEAEYFRYNLKTLMWKASSSTPSAATTPGRAPTGTPRTAPPTPTP